MTAIINGFRGKSHMSLGKVTVVAGQKAQIKIPQDIVVKEFVFVGRGTLKATYAGAVPKIRPYGALDGLLSEISLSRKGTDRVRANQGTRQLIHTNERIFGSVDQAIYKVNAANLSGTVLQNVPTFGATTQDTAFQESVTMPLENKLSGAWWPTLFSTQGLQTAVLNFTFGQWGDIQDPDEVGTVAATFTGSVEIEVFASCVDCMLGSSAIGKADWQQMYETKDFSGVQSGNKHYITPQGMVQGILITGTHSNGKPFDFSHMQNTKLDFSYMGIKLAEGSMADYLELDLNKTYITQRRKGSCYLSFLHNADFETGLFIGENKQIEMNIWTDASLSYASPVRLTFEYDQIDFKAGKVPSVSA